MHRGLVLPLLLIAACGASTTTDGSTTTAISVATTIVSATTAVEAATTIPPPETTTSAVPATTTTTISPFARPDWLGTRVLPLRDDGFGEIQPTPPELIGRAFEPIHALNRPDTTEFEASISEVPAPVVSRSTWHEDCPVTLDDLRYLTMQYWGFDGEVYTGEMIVHVDVAADITGVFEQLFDAGFPIEDMRVTSPDDLEAAPTGDGNNTTGFVCRPVVTSTTTWSQHAYGLAVDINPFHNPYEKGDLVLPELSSYYLDRELAEPGMILEGDVVTQAFDAIGWGWGGRWNSLDDYMHFSQNGR